MLTPQLHCNRPRLLSASHDELSLSSSLTSFHFYTTLHLNKQPRRSASNQSNYKEAAVATSWAIHIFPLMTDS